MQAPPRIPGYELMAYLGGGPMTMVYSARECTHGASCAVKLIREDWEDQLTAIKLMQREARAGLQVSHPHLVRLLDTHVTQPPYFLVMELLGGEPLRRRLRRDYHLDVPTSLWIARQTAEALAALHRAGFLHGDIKPDNIRLVSDGTAKLIDLGFAHRPSENAHLRRQGYLLGTANYLAPELCLWTGDESFSTDLFSFGVTLFEMLAGELPYPAGSVEQVMRRHHEEEPADIQSVVGPLPNALTGLIRRLLSRQPQDRPKSTLVVQQLIALEIAALRRRLSA